MILSNTKQIYDERLEKKKRLFERKNSKVNKKYDKITMPLRLSRELTTLAQDS